nr:MAG TPA: hypothetical protein [Caudoviricetes sp.]
MVLSSGGQLGEVFFRFHLRLHIQSPQFNDGRQYLVNGKGVKFIKPLFRGVRDIRICVFGHYIGNVLKHLKGEQIKIGIILIPFSHSLLQGTKVFINISVKLDSVNSRNGCRCLEWHLLSVNLYFSYDTHASASLSVFVVVDVM